MVPRRVVAVYQAIADPTRRVMLDYLRQGPQPVSAIAERFPISRPAVSRHLRTLRRALLVIQERHGRERIQRLNPEPLREVEHWLGTYRQFWGSNLAALKAYVEANPEAPVAEGKRRARRRG